LLLDVTEQVMIEDGYAAVTSRSVAKRAGVTPALVHYYFPTLDDLFIAALRRRSEQQLERHARLLASPQPLRALWSFSSEQAATTLLMEFMALANHRKSIGRELAAHADKFRQIQVDALGSHLAESGSTGDVAPVVLLVLIASISRTIVTEEAIGMKTGLAETIAVVEDYLTRVEGPAPVKKKRKKSSSSVKKPQRKWSR
jgi:AcrR family transcriptional regulator